LHYDTSYSNWIGKEEVKFHRFIILFIPSIQQLLLRRRLFTIATLLGQTDRQINSTTTQTLWL